MRRGEKEERRRDDEWKGSKGGLRIGEEERGHE